MMPSVPQLLIVGVIVILVFGYGWIKKRGGEIGTTGIKVAQDFRKAIGDDEEMVNDFDKGIANTANSVKRALGDGVKEIKNEVTKTTRRH